jgi:hypothetical protein
MLSALDYLQDQHYEVTMDSWLRSFVGDTIQRGSNELANKELSLKLERPLYNAFTHSFKDGK